MNSIDRASNLNVATLPAIPDYLEFRECRPHHQSGDHSTIIAWLVDDPNLSIVDAANKYGDSCTSQAVEAKDLIDDARTSNPEVYRVIVGGFRQRFGKKFDDESVPPSVAHDYLAGNPENFRRNRMLAALSMLTGEGSRRIQVTLGMDNICRGVRDGACGFHCMDLQDKGEAEILTGFYDTVMAYLSKPETQQAAQSDPERYRIDATLASFTDIREREYPAVDGQGTPRLVQTMDISLDLFRDVLTHGASRGTILRFSDLPQFSSQQ